MSLSDATGGQPPSYKTNVNRAKTKRWVEAKSYSYDGDDWGEVDDYNEYGGYEEPEPPPVTKPAGPTGLRQRGQSASNAALEGYHSPANQGRQTYGQLDHSHSNQQAAARSFTTPQPQYQSGPQRTNSFDPDEERRAFSGPYRSEYEGQPPRSTAQGQYVAGHDFQHGQNAPQQVRSMTQGGGQPTPQALLNQNPDERMINAAQAQEPQGAYRTSLHDRSTGQPTAGRSQSMASNNSALNFHHRQDISTPTLSSPPRAGDRSSPHNADAWHPPRKSSLSQEAAPGQQFGQLPQPASSTSVGDAARARASSNASGKSLPFVRPADIYRRMEEERERERQSHDSGRPDMESLPGGSHDRPQFDHKRTSESGQRTRVSLNTVQERQSEHLSETPKIASQSSRSDATHETEDTGEKIPTTSKRFEIKKSADAPTRAGPKLLGPVLPDVARMSSFGDSFGDSFLTSPIESNEQKSSTMIPAQTKSVAPTQDHQVSGLQHQPSLGFTSAVHHSFDQAQDQVPPTPSSLADSSVQRSGSGGTSTVSPIISRGPSNSNQVSNDRMPGIEGGTSHLHAPEVESALGKPDTRSFSSSPTRIPRDSSPLQEETALPPYVPGHRRNMSTPSPDNSPARTPALEYTRQLRNPEELEVTSTTPTPTDTDSSTGDNLHASDHGESNKFAKPELPMTPTQGLLSRRTDSSGSGRVRNLADKFESTSRPQSAQSTTPRQSVLGITGGRLNDFANPRPQNERLESFRPHLPGAWESSASIAPASLAPISRPRSVVDSSRTATPERDQESASTLSYAKNTSQDSVFAATTAGEALTDALTSTPSEDSHRSRDRVDDAEQYDETPSHSLGASHKAISNKSAFYPEAAPEPLTLPHHDGRSSGATSLARDTTPSATDERSLSEHFAPSRPEKAHRDHADRATLSVTSTGAQPEEYESDRLSREIVKGLSPDIPTEQFTTESAPFLPSSQHLLPRSSGTPADDADVNTRTGHESGVLPKGYDNYFDDKNSENGSSVSGGEPTQMQNVPVSDHQNGVIPVDEPLHLYGQKGSVPSKSLETSQLEPQRPEVLPHRFSWEQPLHEIVPPSAATPTQTSQRGLNDHPRGPAVDENVQLGMPRGDRLQQASSGGSSVVETSTLGLDGSLRTSGTNEHGPVETAIPSGPHSDALGSIPMPHRLDNSNTEPPLQKSQLIDPSTHGRMDGADVTSPQVLQLQDTLREDPSTSEGLIAAPSEDLIAQKDPAGENIMSTMPASIDKELPPLAVPSGTQSKIPAFREILALKTPKDRIGAYDHTRQQFADSNTGLGHWISVSLDRYPEHTDLLTSQGRSINMSASHKYESSKIKSGGFLPSQSTNDAPPTPNSLPQGAFNAGSSGGKMSSQQVQAKSKELLHTAGVFGGKANVAAKGLFSKGKSKLRGASGSNQASIRSSKRSKPGLMISDVRAQTLPRDSAEKPAIVSQARGSPVTGRQSHSYDREIHSSIETSSQGRLADDERSDESIESVSDPEILPQRPSVLFIGDRHREIRTPVAPGNDITGTEGEILLQKRSNTGSTGSNFPTPRQTHNQWSTTSSNKTPTQLDFDQNATPPLMTHLQERTESPVEITGDMERDRHAAEVTATRHDTTTMPDTHDATEKLQKTSYPSSLPTDLDAAEQDPREIKSNRLSALLGPALKESKMPIRPSDIQTNALGAPSPGPSPFLEGTPQSYQSGKRLDQPRSRGISVGSVQSAVDTERPPSPISPTIPHLEQTSMRQGQVDAPVHHDIHHDFVDVIDPVQERSGRRSPSMFMMNERTSFPEESHFSQYGLAPYDRYEDQQASRTNNENDPTLPYHKAPQSSRSNSRTRVQAPEYQLESTGFPEFPPVELKSRSRSRSASRSSAFFKNLSASPSRNPQPALPGAADSLPISDSTSRAEGIQSGLHTSGQYIPPVGQRHSQNGQGLSEQHVMPRAATMPVSSSTHTETASDHPQPRDESSVKNRSIPSKRLSKRLERASTTANDAGKKKRFSSIGSIFSRQKRQSTNGMTPPEVHAQEGTLYPNKDRNQLDSERSQQEGPLNGYYAPTRTEPRRASYRRQMSDVPAYVQDSALRRSSTHHNATAPYEMRPSEDVMHQGSVPPAPPPTSLQTPAARSPPPEDRPLASRAARSWSRFSRSSRSRTRHSQPALETSIPQESPEHARNIDPNQRSFRDSYLNRKSWRDRSTSRQRQKSFRPESPPPPPPPPKDDVYVSGAAHARSASQPMQGGNGSAQQVVSARMGERINERNTMIEQRSPLPSPQAPVPGDVIGSRRSQYEGPVGSATLSPEEKRRSRQQEIEQGYSNAMNRTYAHDGKRWPETTEQRPNLPSLNTNMMPSPSQRASGINPGRSPQYGMTPEEKRRSRQEEIEKGHLSIRRGRQPDEYGGGEERVVMSATSFPGQEWQPEYLHWDEE